MVLNLCLIKLGGGGALILKEAIVAPSLYYSLIDFLAFKRGSSPQNILIHLLYNLLIMDHILRE